MTYIAMEDLNFDWEYADIQTVKKAWKRGESLVTIGRHLNRDPDEVTVLVMDLIRKRVIFPRVGGATGWGG